MPIDALPILIVGGAGYIGSHMVLTLQQAGYTPIVLDNLVKGHGDAVRSAGLIVGTMQDEHLLEQLFSQHRFAAVMHFASFIEVGESVKNPLKYYENNVAASLILLKKMIQHNVRSFIFSSTAAVYGEPEYTPIDEHHPIRPINPYGRSKAMIEQILQDLVVGHELNFASLRYFNAAGADPQGHLGERHEPESHLIPLVLQVAQGKKEHITIHGRDYPTKDGTCIRDYIHVTDLCGAHLLALQALFDGEQQLIANLGTGRGYSVQEVIDVAKKVTQCPIATITGPRRSGDPAILVANPHFAMERLGWIPHYSDLETIIQHAWNFVSR